MSASKSFKHGWCLTFVRSYISGHSLLLATCFYFESVYGFVGGMSLSGQSSLSPVDILTVRLINVYTDKVEQNKISATNYLQKHFFFFKTLTVRNVQLYYYFSFLLFLPLQLGPPQKNNKKSYKRNKNHHQQRRPNEQLMHIQNVKIYFRFKMEQHNYMCIKKATEKERRTKMRKKWRKPYTTQRTKYKNLSKNIYSKTKTKCKTNQQEKYSMLKP